MNYTGGDAYNVVENAAYAAVDSNGEVSVQNGPNTASTANIVVDEDAYFVPQPFSVRCSLFRIPTPRQLQALPGVRGPATIAANGTSQAEFL